MATKTYGTVTSNRLGSTALRIGIVVLTLSTAYIHATLGGLLFTLNAIGYVVLAIALVLPGPVAQGRWLVRLALIGFTLATIAGWVAFGARFELAYIDKAIEVVMVLALVVDLWVSDGSPIAIARRIVHLPAAVVRGFSARA